jgi:hypothetical protein
MYVLLFSMSVSRTQNIPNKIFRDRVWDRTKNNVWITFCREPACTARNMPNGSTLQVALLSSSHFPHKRTVMSAIYSPPSIYVCRWLRHHNHRYSFGNSLIFHCSTFFFKMCRTLQYVCVCVFVCASTHLFYQKNNILKQLCFASC